VLSKLSSLRLRRHIRYATGRARRAARTLWKTIRGALPGISPINRQIERVVSIRGRFPRICCLSSLLALPSLPVACASVSRRSDHSAASHNKSPTAHEAVRRSYDAVAADYLATFADELTRKPLDRALLRMLAEETGPDAPVADVGCGPGHVAAFLASLGTKAVGIDLSEQMIEIGRRSFPAAEFRSGDLLSLPADEGEFAAVVAFYSIIHLEPDELPVAFGELRRILRPSGILLLSFHAGDEARQRHEWLGHEVDLTFRFFEPTRVVELLEQAEFEVEVSLVRRHYPQEVETRRAYLLARPAR